ncbi:DUF3040 domain-containing protein [Corynebacterium phoceense]|uniref:DUF3040 domain-containing protein n=1 Tax=Corynebacterium phoceense TaxID=1686286 RepID=A0A540RAC2_9CORY|nr:MULTISPECIES: DUF3040 domain-containing protein [Corynebacterium]MBF9010755.1 DUF3040 domain-containing protein [Corynebacterium phoceense]MCQ9330568.1 DUF3040 domain-containing protein [Corynebacterium phoceense]MCQ9340362.1 DUF3040 domain-containing protein [Corynebacterium phoceense]MCQ9344357.1 DUF3040 domain-containing protein [Corynebacterium phoceense]MCQ9346964.1 DUF3040 domain-containing protein [Corynebacterium phoceense]
MSLSEQEMRTLREIEQSLMADDPKFSAAVTEASATEGATGHVTLRGVALVVVGLVLLVGGVALAQMSLWFVALSIVGFLVMFGAGVWMLRGDANVSSVAKTSARGAWQKAPKRNPQSGGMEDKFRSRFER